MKNINKVHQKFSYWRLLYHFRSCHSLVMRQVIVFETIFMDRDALQIPSIVKNTSIISKIGVKSKYLLSVTIPVFPGRLLLALFEW